MNKEVHIDNLKWYSPFYLNKPISAEPDLLKLQGVYLWVYENDAHKKIIYVGSAWSQKGFIKRIKEEISDILTGGAFIFNIKQSEDPYNLLTKTDIELGQNFYYPDRGNLNEEYSWVKDYAQQYLAKLRYWICPLEDNKILKKRELCQLLETQIQAVIKEKYAIKYVEEKPHLSWLGKLDKLNDPNTEVYHFEFETFPDIDDNSIFRNLSKNAKNAIKKIKQK